jgi:hypothetical protein
MPNWCWNHLEVTGDEIQLREFVEKSTIDIERDDEFSFNGTHPMHEDLNITKGTQTQDEKEQAMLNKAKYGHTDWYDWRCEEWGTKWDACEPNIQHNNIDYFAVSFETAWSPPIAWIDNIMQDFPDLCFTLEYEEPGMCFGGRLSAQYEVMWDDNNWDIDQASDCCEAEVYYQDDEKYSLLEKETLYGTEYQCSDCKQECETVSINVADIKPAKIKTNESK